MEQLPLTVTLEKQSDGTMKVKSKMDTMKLDAFLANMKEGDKVEVTYEPIHSEVSYAQLSKLHKCIRIIAAETGHSFDDIKTAVKVKAGLYSHIDKLKSFGALTKEEISTAIQTAIDIGAEIGISL